MSTEFVYSRLPRKKLLIVLLGIKIDGEEIFSEKNNEVETPMGAPLYKVTGCAAQMGGLLAILFLEMGHICFLPFLEVGPKFSIFDQNQNIWS